MKPKNFPARKLQRQLNANNRADKVYSRPNDATLIAAARQVRTKINRSSGRHGR